MTFVLKNLRCKIISVISVYFEMLNKSHVIPSENCFTFDFLLSFTYCDKGPLHSFVAENSKALQFSFFYALSAPGTYGFTLVINMFSFLRKYYFLLLLHHLSPEVSCQITLDFAPFPMPSFFSNTSQLHPKMILSSQNKSQ